jgi:hypothetical protein
VIINPFRNLAMEHTDKQFDLELSSLRTKLSQMGDMAMAQLDQALGCLSEHDVHGARVSSSTT